MDDVYVVLHTRGDKIAGAQVFSGPDALTEAYEAAAKAQRTAGESVSVHGVGPEVNPGDEPRQNPPRVRWEWRPPRIFAASIDGRPVLYAVQLTQGPIEWGGTLQMGRKSPFQEWNVIDATEGTIVPGTRSYASYKDAQRVAERLIKQAYGQP